MEQADWAIVKTSIKLFLNTWTGIIFQVMLGQNVQLDQEWQKWAGVPEHMASEEHLLPPFLPKGECSCH